MNIETKDPVQVDPERRTVAVPHWGITLRTLFGAALDSWPDRAPGESREFTVIHKTKPIATINVRQHHEL